MRAPWRASATAPGRIARDTRRNSDGAQQCPRDPASHAPYIRPQLPKGSVERLLALAGVGLARMACSLGLRRTDEQTPPSPGRKSRSGAPTAQQRSN